MVHKNLHVWRAFQEEFNPPLPFSFVLIHIVGNPSTIVGNQKSWVQYTMSDIR